MAGAVKITYFDTAMALIEVGPFRLLTDPVLDSAGTTFEYGLIQLRKTSAAAVSAQDLGPIDAVLLSHDQHGDNLDGGGRALLERVPLVLTTPLAASRLENVRAKALAPWESHVLVAPGGAALTITGTPAQHGPDGTEEATGPVTGFIIQHDTLSAPIYISGDTIRFSGTEEIARRYSPVGLALLNLGQVQLAALNHATLSLSAEEASSYAQALEARWIVPLHFDGWQRFTEDRAAAASVFARQPVGDRVRWMSPGETSEFQI